MKQPERRQFRVLNEFDAFSRQSEEGFAPVVRTIKSDIFLWADLEYEKGKPWDGVKDPVHFRIGTYGDYFVDRTKFLRSTQLVNP